jgi:uroporphyrinogen decarboxylase
MELVGYDNLCYMLYDEPELVQEIFDNVGSRIVEYYNSVAGADTVGVLVSNDDWGFNTQSFLSPEMMRKYLFPWHKKIVDTIHSYGKPVILHSCGNYSEVIDDVIDDLKYDARHSYEDNIIPVEDAYESLNGRIAVIGGIDVN